MALGFSLEEIFDAEAERFVQPGSPLAESLTRVRGEIVNSVRDFFAYSINPEEAQVRAEIDRRIEAWRRRVFEINAHRRYQKLMSELGVAEGLDFAQFAVRAKRGQSHHKSPITNFFELEKKKLRPGMLVRHLGREMHIVKITPNCLVVLEGFTRGGATTPFAVEPVLGTKGLEDRALTEQ